MIAIASDKFKGTLTSREAGRAIAEGLAGLHGLDIRVLPMADGGEGTAEALGAVPTSDGFFEYRRADGTTAAYISSCGTATPGEPPLRCRSSIATGRAIRRAAESGRYSRIDVGIGGTRTADGGMGLLEGMGYTIERDDDGLPLSIIAPTSLAPIYRDTVRGLADVGAPLYSECGLSAMSFLAQKGGNEADIAFCSKLFRRLTSLYGTGGIHGGAGGGIGFALEVAAGCEVTFGAPVILKKALQGLPKPSIIVTGEGRVDAQTDGGKTVAAVFAHARRLGIPAVAFCGVRTADVDTANIFACVPEGAPLPADPYRALVETVRNARPEIEKLLNND